MNLIEKQCAVKEDAMSSHKGISAELRYATALKWFLQHEPETRISRPLVAGEIPDGATLTIALEKSPLAIEHGIPQSETQ